VFAARPQLLGCAAVAALLCAGCGSGGGPTGETPATVASRPAGTTPAKPRQAHREDRQARKPGGPCQSQLGSFVAAMDSLRRRLAVGVTYDQYVNEIHGIGSIYRKIPIAKVGIDCLGAVGGPSEKAYNRYIVAANDWGDCVSELGCGSASVEPVLQRRWRIASRLLSEAEEGLRELGP
jgi:hypothetical protein